MRRILKPPAAADARGVTCAVTVQVGRGARFFSTLLARPYASLAAHTTRTLSPCIESPPSSLEMVTLEGTMTMTLLFGFCC